MTTFKDLGLSDEVLKVLVELGFEKPSKIQAAAIPKLMEGDNDLVGLAQTGTGKTAAFGLPLLERMNPYQKATQALVLAPTRELGRQIAEQLDIFSKYMDKVSVLPVYGGASIVNQIRDLRRTQHVIIATPGRLLDLIKRKAINLSEVRYVVLDEADEMLNMGFKEDLDEILSYTPEDKQTWLFSATMPAEIKRIVKKYMDDPVEVKINSKDKVNVNIKHQFVMLRQSDKIEALMRFVDINPTMRSVVFCRTKRETQALAERMLKNNYKADALHGDLSQAQRDRVMERFKAKHLQLLVATDVAARGIDVDDLTHVFHYSLPDDNSYYTHRSGRTARAGKKGISIAFIHSREGYRINRLERQLGISFQQIFVPKVEAIADIRMEAWCENIIEKNTKGKLNKVLIEKAEELLKDVTKEELIEKILTAEFEKLNLTGAKDLNSNEDRRSNRDDRRRGGRDRRDFRGSRGSGRSGRDKGKKFSKKRKPEEGKFKKKKKSASSSFDKSSTKKSAKKSSAKKSSRWKKK